MKIAESFRIGHLLARRPGEISGGERQRVGLARSLVTDPEILLLDEPLTALDHGTQSRIMDDLRQWNADRRIPILYVTHSQREVFALGERVLALQDGANRCGRDASPSDGAAGAREHGEAHRLREYPRSGCRQPRPRWRRDGHASRRNACGSRNADC